MAEDFAVDLLIIGDQLNSIYAVPFGYRYCLKEANNVELIDTK